jgi:hypothetical protein
MLASMAMKGFVMSLRLRHAMTLLEFKGARTEGLMPKTRCLL